MAEQKPDVVRWELELAALEANKTYCIARALVFLHDGNHALRHSYLAMVDGLNEQMDDIRVHLASIRKVFP